MTLCRIPLFWEDGVAGQSRRSHVCANGSIANAALRPSPDCHKEIFSKWYIKDLDQGPVPNARAAVSQHTRVFWALFCPCHGYRVRLKLPVETPERTWGETHLPKIRPGGTAFLPLHEVTSGREDLNYWRIKKKESTTPKKGLDRGADTPPRLAARWLLACSESPLETDKINATQGSWCCSSLEEYCHICGHFLPIQLDLPTPWLKWRIK